MEATTILQAKGATMRRMPRLNIELDDELHRRVKAQAAIEGKTLKDFVIDAILEKLPPTQPAPRPPRKQ